MPTPWHCSNEVGPSNFGHEIRNSKQGSPILPNSLKCHPVILESWESSRKIRERNPSDPDPEPSSQDHEPTLWRGTNLSSAACQRDPKHGTHGGDIYGERNFWGVVATQLFFFLNFTPVYLGKMQPHFWRRDFSKGGETRNHQLEMIWVVCKDTPLGMPPWTCCDSRIAHQGKAPTKTDLNMLRL